MLQDGFVNENENKNIACISYAAGNCSCEGSPVSSLRSRRTANRSVSLQHVVCCARRHSLSAEGGSSGAGFSELGCAVRP